MPGVCGTRAWGSDRGQGVRGFGSGVLWGSVVGAIGLVVISENTPLPGVAPVAEATAAVPEAAAEINPEPATQEVVAPTPETEVPAAPAAEPEPTSEPAASTSEPAAEATPAETAEPATAAEPAPVAEPEAEETAPAAASQATSTEPAAAQEPAAAPESAVTPEAPQDGVDAAEPQGSTVAEAVEVPAGSEFARALPDQDPVVPGTSEAPASAAAPAVGAPDAGQALPSTDTMTAAAPEPDLTSPDAPGQPEVDSALPDLGGAAPQPAAPSAIVAPETPTADALPSDADLPPPPPLTPEEQALADTAPEATPEVALTPDAAEPEAEAETEAPVAVLPTDPPLAPVTPLPEVGLSRDAALAGPESGFSGEVDGVVTNRLPRIGDAPPATEEDAAAAVSDAPIDRYSRKFDNPTGKPVFAIVLVDDGDPGLDREKLAQLPFPVTFALDPQLPDAGQIAADYRAAGQEVIMLATGIPEGANASDIEVTFAAHAAAMPEAVGVLDLAQGGFQGNRPLATMVVPVIKGQGRGLLTYDAGLNAADQVASRDEVRAATVFRRIDPDGEPVGAIRRTLDRAAFKAAQTGRVAVVGEARPETVAALLEWSVEGRAAAVALAPASAVMVTR
ncbi:MAG: hypothetical protein DI533_05115 [Cereibacter sphaeroides]|uniref:Divergent polysaccharide deacetylase family protein n=1 Tax=Cereibacter sphaeroides TaxID=1063 RepID=A0A2W5U9H8_CERSP|nr:MAG: hypothetical protein DI533_05115 [Cereibacter sphaeroides]